MSWTDYSKLDPAILEVLPERFKLAARWTKYMPLEYVLQWTYWQIAALVDGDPILGKPDNYPIVIFDNRHCPMTVIPLKLWDDTMTYMMDVDDGLIFGDEPALLEPEIRQLVFRGPNREGASIDVYLAAFSGHFPIDGTEPSG